MWVDVAHPVGAAIEWRTSCRLAPTVQASAAMIERFVFFRLKPEHANAQSLADIRTRSMRLASIPGVSGLTIGAPSDPAAAAAWDLCLVVRFETLDAVFTYLDHPEHVAYYAFLEPRLQVIKAWNFDV